MVRRTPDGQDALSWNAVVLANLPKETVSADSKAKRLHSFRLSAAALLVVGLQDIEVGRGDIQNAAKAMQAAVVLLCNASQHHAVQHRQVILQQLNPKLKSLIKDEDFRDATTFLFGERFASVAKERLDAAAVLKKTVVTGKLVFQRSHPQKYFQTYGPQGGQFNGNSYKGKKTRHAGGTSTSKPSQGRKCLEPVQISAPQQSHVLKLTNYVTSAWVETPLHGLQSGAHQPLQVLMDSMNMGIACLALAGRLPSFLENWQLLTQEAWVLQVVRGTVES